MVQDAARSFVADRMPVSQLRGLRSECPRRGFDPAIWQEMAALGWPGIAIAEEHGGAGLGIRALGAVIEVMGTSLAASPLASTALVAATVIARCGSEDARARWLPVLAEGRVIAALATREGAQASEARPETALTRAKGAVMLNGAKCYVADATGAGLLLVSARDGAQDVLALIRADAPGVTITQRASIDGHLLSDIRFAGTPVADVLTARPARDPVAFAEDCACVALAAEMLGACSRAFDVTLDYMRTRQQFGQTIGSFQALQHRAAGLFIELELARSCVLAVVDALHHDDAALPVLASLAKATMGELMRQMSYEMIQLHGGIGMTDAHDAGLYLKRGRAAALLHGDAAWHRDRYARLQGY